MTVLDPSIANSVPGRGHDRPTRGSMTLRSVRDLLDATEVFCPDPRVRCAGIVAADLMSDVLVEGQPGALLLTGLVTVQAVRTAVIADLAGVVFVRGKMPADDVIALARAERIPLFVTGRSLFDASGILFCARTDTPAGTATGG